MKEGFFSAGLIAPRLAAADSAEAIRRTGELLEAAGYVNGDYIESVLEREKNFPTGLQLADAAVAIPHATPEDNVLRNGIAVARLERPVKFRSMEDPEEQVEAELVFLLALKDSNQHLEILKDMFTGFQKPEVLRALKASPGAQGILSVMEEHFGRTLH